MAAANLLVSDEFVALFEKAQRESIRWVQVKISTVTFEVVNHGMSSGDLAKDLGDVRNALDKEASMVLVCVDEAAVPKKWVVVAFVPETSLVKRRMLYASGRQDIKSKLGQQYFKGEAHVGEVSELIVENVMRERTDYEDLAYTDHELLMKEEHAASARPGQKLERGMASVQFGLGPGMEQALTEFNNGQVDWVSCKVEADEKIHLVEKELINDIKQSVQSKIEDKEPRFYLVHRKGTPVGDQTYLVFSCPENSQIKLRMVYSTSKATLIEYASYGGLKFRMLEIRSSDELDELFAREETVDEDAGKIVHLDVSKPRGPGGRRRQSQKN